MTISVVIRTYNEEKWIGLCLDRIFSQKLEDDLEVIVVDSNSTDRTVDIAKEYDTKIINIPKEKFTFGRGINYGIKHARGEYIALISAHAIPYNNNWLSNLIRNFSNKSVAGVYGKQIPFKNAYPMVVRDMKNFFGDRKIIHDNLKNLKFSNANSCIRRDIWEKIPFDENLSASEDLKWAKDVILAGYKIVYEPEAVVYHSHNESLNQVYRRSLRESKANNKVIGISLSLKMVFGLPIVIAKDIVFILKIGNIKWIPFVFPYRFAQWCGILKSLLEVRD